MRQFLDIPVSFLLTMLKYTANSLALLLAVSLLLFSNITPALAETQIAALGALDRAVSADETDLKLSPGGDYYTGLEYTDTTPDPAEVNDDVIEKNVKSKTDSRVIVSVANGSVMLSGKVHNQREADKLISQVKEIPGVHEVTFELQLEKR